MLKGASCLNCQLRVTLQLWAAPRRRACPGCSEPSEESWAHAQFRVRWSMGTTLVVGAWAAGASVHWRSAQQGCHAAWAQLYLDSPLPASVFSHTVIEDNMFCTKHNYIQGKKGDSTENRKSGYLSNLELYVHLSSELSTLVEFKPSGRVSSCVVISGKERHGFREHTPH